MGEDPIGFASEDFNFYRYVYNNSINYTDPYGYFGWIDIFLPTPLGSGSDTFPDLKYDPKNKKLIPWDPKKNKPLSKPKLKCETRTPPLSEKPWLDDLIKQKQKRNLPAKRPGKLGTLFDLLCKLFGC